MGLADISSSFGQKKKYKKGNNNPNMEKYIYIILVVLAILIILSLYYINTPSYQKKQLAINSNPTSLKNNKKTTAPVNKPDSLKYKDNSIQKKIIELEEQVKKLKTEATIQKVTSKQIVRKKLSNAEKGLSSCWMTTDGEKTLKLLALEMYDNYFVVDEIWPDRLEYEANKMNLYRENFYIRRRIDNDEFKRIFSYVFQYNLKNKPHCRFIVKCIDKTSNKRSYKSQQRLVKQYLFFWEP